MNLEKLKETARRFEQKEEWKKAIDVYLKAIAEVESGRDPHPDLAVYNRLGDLYLKTSDNNAAIRAYERAAELYAEQGFFNNAIALCGKILRLNPQRSPIYLRLAALHARKNVVIEAKRNLLAYMERMHAAGQLDEAFAAVRQSADEFSGNQELRLMLVDLLKAASREDEARDELQKVAAVLEARGEASAAEGLRSQLVEIAVDFSGPTESFVSSAPPPAAAAPPAAKNSDLVFLDVGAVIDESELPAAPAPASGLPLIVGDPLAQGADEALDAAELPTGHAPPNLPVDGRSVIEDPFDGMSVQQVEGIELTHVDAEAVGTASLLEGLEVLGDVDLDSANSDAVDGIERNDSPSPTDAPIAALDGLEGTIVEPIAEALDTDEAAAGDDASAVDDEPVLEDADAFAPSDELPTEDEPSADDAAPAVMEIGADDERSTEPADVPSADEEPEAVRDAEDEVLDDADAALLDATLVTDDAEAAPEEEPEFAAPGDVVLLDVEGEALSIDDDPAESDDEIADADGTEAELPVLADDADPATENAEPEFEVSSEASVELPVLEEDADTEGITLAEPLLDVETITTDFTAEAPVSEEEALAELATEVPELASLAPVPLADTLRTLIESLEDQVADNPGEPGLHHRLADALLDAGEVDRALEELAHALVGYEAAGMLEPAWALADRLVGMQPDTIRFHQKRVEVAFRLEDRPRLIEAYLALGDSLVRADAVDKALAVYRRVLDHDPANRQAHGALEAYAPRPPAPAVSPAIVAAVEPAAAQQAQAGPDLPSAVAEDGFIDLGAMILEPEPERDTRMVTAIQPPTGDEDRDFEEALAAFKRGIEENLADTDYEAHYDLGVAFKEMGLLDEAIAEFQKALRAPDGRLRTSEALGQAFLEKGQTAIAEAVLRRAVESLEGGDDLKVGVLYWLGRSAELQGRTNEAVAAYERALAVDIRFADVSERLARLGAGRGQ